jgi:ferredoxin-nitrate reductase
MRDSESICPYCGVGCRLQIEGSPASGLHIRGVADAPANLGRVCAKAVLLGETINTPDRLTRPMIRHDRRQRFQETDWHTAIGHAAETFQQIIRKHGPDAVAFYGSGQLDSEGAFLAVKLFKGTLHTNNTDSNSRLCMASAVAGYRSSLGGDGPPTCYDDIDHADVMMFLGSNAAEAHPVLFDRVRAAKKLKPGLFIITIDPRRTPTARDSDLHLAVAPGSDIALLNALARLILEFGYVDWNFIHRHTSGFSEYRDFLRAGDLRQWSAACGIELDVLRTVARRIGEANALLSMYCMGMGQSTIGTWKNNSIINLHLLTGQIGKVGAGPFSLTGQPNAMGGREVGLLSHQLPGYRFVDNAEHRRELEAAWNQPPGSIQATPGLTAVEMFRALEKGKLKAIWIAATNPMVSLPDLHQVRRALQRAELVIVSDAYQPTETTQFAHFLFPVAQWGEKEWTSTSSERLVSHSPKLFDPPGDAKPDWQIIADFAKMLGLSGFEYECAAQVWDEFRKLTVGRPCDMAGISAARLRRERHVYWPCPHEDQPGAKRRYLDRLFPTSDGRAKFLARSHNLPRESSDHEFPYVLTTGRLYSHWHTLTRTGKCSKLVKRDPEPYVEIHPEDATRLNIEDGEVIQLSSRRGTIQLPARISTAVPPGVVFLPFHWGDLYAPQNAANYLTIAALDGTSKQPEFKICAISLEKIAPKREQIPAPAKAADPSLSLPVLS